MRAPRPEASNSTRKNYLLTSLWFYLSKCVRVSVSTCVELFLSSHCEGPGTEVWPSHLAAGALPTGPS